MEAANPIPLPASPLKGEERGAADFLPSLQEEERGGDGVDARQAPIPVLPFLNHGIRDNFAQFAHQVAQVFFVGLTLGMMRTVVPALSETEFSVARGDQRGFAIGVNEFSGYVGVAVADIAHPDWRGSAIGIYRFWRDFGYAVGALLLGVAAAVSGALEITFWLVGGAMFASGLLVRLFSEETLPRLNPAE